MTATTSRERGHPLRFLVFLLIVALLLAYAADRWERHYSTTFADREPAGLIGELADRGTVEDDLSEESAEPAPLDDEITDIVDDPQIQEGGTSEARERFAGQRLERDRMRSRQIALLESVAADPEAGSDERSQARAEMMRLQEAMTVESELEQLLRVRGFDEAFVLRHREGVVVVVAAPELTAADVRQIAALTERVAGVGREEIGIMADPGT